MNHIELFAGCGGLSLGLDTAGFELLFANELSPMAAETFAFNFFNEDLEELAKTNTPPKNVIWINSKFDKLASRLRENPFEFPAFNSNDTELPHNPKDLKGKLAVGSLIELNSYIKHTPSAIKALREGLGSPNGLDLVSGGPPCQSFSMAGKREKNSDKNSLPWAFAEFVELTQPKIALLENVTGILRPFKGDDGKPYYAWYEVAKVFASIGYAPLCLHINARHAGVPQNRPRFIMIGLREDILEQITPRLKGADQKLFEQPKRFIALTKQHGDTLPYGYLEPIDTHKTPAPLKGTFLDSLVSENENSVLSALDDLKLNNPTPPSKFVRRLNEQFAQFKNIPDKEIANHDQRRNSDIVKRRFRLYQVLQTIGERKVTNAVFDVLRGNTTELDRPTWEKLKPYKYLNFQGELATFSSARELYSFLSQHPTKKQTQKALDANKPAPAALSIPDDACHYDEEELRVLTVREMARIQSFPDSFEFRSKITTGGKMRRFEVPQYTQVGNAVPPLLGLKLGIGIRKLLSLQPQQRTHI